MRTAVHVDDAGVVDYLREYQDGVLGDDDLVVAVVGVGQERRTRSEKRDQLIPKAEDPRGSPHAPSRRDASS